MKSTKQSGRYRTEMHLTPLPEASAAGVHLRRYLSRKRLEWFMADDPERAKRVALHDELRAVIGGFLADFAVAESMYLTVCVGALSQDQTVIDYIEDLMDLERRLTLLKTRRSTATAG